MSMDGPASTTAAHDAEQVVQGIKVHILSPSPDLPNRLTFPNLDKKTTLGDLKERIQNAISSRPSPAWQRLIYRARPLVRDGATLEDIFGSLAVQEVLAKEIENEGGAHI